MLIRKAAIECLRKVFHASLKADLALERSGAYFQPRDRRLLHELVYGVLRRRYSLEADFSRFCKTKPDETSEAALLLGTYQLRHMRIPAHAAVSETVAAIRQLQPKASGFVNAVLRRVADSEPPLKLKPSQRVELPKWMYARWRDAFGADTVLRFCDVFKSTPPLCVAVFVDREKWLAQVCGMDIEAEAGELSDYAVLLPSGTDVTSLPGYDSGAFTVIDQAAQAAVMDLNISNPSALILDLCAAPGGKTAMLARRFPEARIIAVELNAGRISRLRENLSRLQCGNVTVVRADAIRLPFPDASAAAILLDAPCSASGILRRHPDAKFLHDAVDIDKLACIQRSMITESLRVLKEGGQMTYAVCSIHPQENELVLDGIDAVTSMQRLFPDTKHDGFFHAAIKVRYV
ncbi:MAG: transcription antitermination factor NusB [Mariprofundus sp.]|nr:transcription antitermination factor NusB [Mariprofundus sp.]